MRVGIPFQDRRSRNCHPNLVKRTPAAGWIFPSSLVRLFYFVLLLAAILGSEFLVAQQSTSNAGPVKESAGPMASEQGYLNLRSLRSIDSLSAAGIATQDDAENYVRQVAKLCGAKEKDDLTDALLARLVNGELAAAHDPAGLVPDDRVANAFNFLSDQLRVAHSRRLTGAEVRQYRTTRLAIYPHLFGEGNVSGTRPVGAVLMLCMLVLNGGVPEETENSAGTALQSSSLKNDPHRANWGDGTPYRAAREYRIASTTYFQELTPQGLQSFVGSVAKIMALPEAR
jgi:hypothetical protein